MILYQCFLILFYLALPLPLYLLLLLQYLLLLFVRKTHYLIILLFQTNKHVMALSSVSCLYTPPPTLMKKTVFPASKAARIRRTMAYYDVGSHEGSDRDFLMY